MPRKLFTSLLSPSLKVTEDQLETDFNLLNMERSILAMNRRNFIGSLAAAGATAATFGAGAFVSKAEAQTTTSVVDVLNFALNLEFLEANLYIAVSGAPALSASVTGSTGVAPTGEPKGIVLDSQTQATAAGLAADETHHIETLIAAITAQGGTPISQPSIDYTAGGTVSITTQAQFLAVARQFTAVGNSAYAGAAQFLIATPSLLSAAAQILGAEGQHLGAINYLCALQGVTSPAVDLLDVPPSSSPISYFTVTPSSTAFTPVGETTPNPTPATLLPPTGPALGIFRTFQDVLGIVYGQTTSADGAPPATGVVKGGFFPLGVNGAITST